MKLIQSFWKALYPTLSRLHRQAQAQYERLARLALRYGLLLLLPAATIGAAVAVGALGFIFGGDYGESAQVFQILLWAAPLFLLENYAITLLSVERHLRASLLILGIHLLVTVVALPPLTNWLGADGTAWAVVLAGALGAVYGLWQLHRLHLPLQVRGLWGMVGGAVARRRGRTAAAVGVAAAGAGRDGRIPRRLLGDRRTVSVRLVYAACHTPGKEAVVICKRRAAWATIEPYA